MQLFDYVLPRGYKMTRYIFNIKPMGKPRFTWGDKANYRKCTQDYWNFKKDLVEQVEKLNYKIPDVLQNITIILPMPKSWSQKKRILMDRKPHQQTPDIDNILKAFQDCLLENDSTIHTYNNIRKIWGLTGQIIIDE